MGRELKKLFIIRGHKNDNNKEVQQLKKLLEGNGYDIRESAADPFELPTAPNKKKGASRSPDPIAWCETVIVLISPDLCHNESVEKEIESAHQQGKRIIGIYVGGGTQSDVPRIFHNFGQALVPLMEDLVINAICGVLNIWYTPVGELVVPRKIEHFKC